MNRPTLLHTHRKLLLRMVLLPVGLLLILGFLFSRTFIENIPFAIVDQDNSSLSRTIVRQFRLHPGFRIDTYLDSEKSLQEAIRTKQVLGGLVIPPGFHRNLADHKSPAVLLLLDGTNVIVATLAQGYGSTILSTLNASFEVTLLEGRGLLPSQTKSSVTSFSFTERVLFEPTLSYLMYLIYMIFLYTTQTLYFGQFLMPYLMEKKGQWLSSGRPPDGWLRELGRTMVLPAAVMVTLGLSTYLGLLVDNQLFGVHIVGNAVQHVVLIVVFLMGLTALGVFATALIRNLRYFLEAYYILALVLMLTCGVAWPGYMMPPGFAVVVQCFWPMFNEAYTIKALHLKGLSWTLLLPVIGKGLAFTAVWGGLGAWLLRRRLNNAR
jgi:ABC-2 type transport system permease protein